MREIVGFVIGDFWGTAIHHLLATMLRRTAPHSDSVVWLHVTTKRAAIAAGKSGATATAKQGGAPCYLAAEERSGEREVQELDQGGFIGSKCEHAEHRQQQARANISSARRGAERTDVGRGRTRK